MLALVYMNYEIVLIVSVFNVLLRRENYLLGEKNLRKCYISTCIGYSKRAAHGGVNYLLGEDIILLKTIVRKC